MKNLTESLAITENHGYIIEEDWQLPNTRKNICDSAVMSVF